MQLRYTDIPAWLQDSAFYEGLSKDEPDCVIDIPTEYFREASYPVQTAEDLAAVLKVTGFWGVTQIPQSVLSFCFTNDVSIWDSVFVDVAGEGMSEHAAVLVVCEDPTKFTLAVALSLARPELITFWLSNNMKSHKGNEYAIAQACGYGRLDLVQTLRERGFNWDYYAYCAAALHGHLHILEYLHENWCIGTSLALDFAARGGQLTCMKYLHTLDYGMWSGVTVEFAVAAHYEYLKVAGNAAYHLPWVDNCPLNPPANGYVECLRYALENKYLIQSRACERAATYGLLDCLRLLHQYNAAWDIDTSAAAASAGHLQCLQFLRKHNCPINYRATEEAAANGHYDCLVYLHQFIPPLGAGATTMAAGRGQLHCLQFLREHGYPWKATATTRAARYGFLHCVQYLHQNGCVWDESTCRNACLGGHLACLHYLHENGCPWDRHSSAAAAAHGHLDCLEYLHIHGCPWDQMAGLWAAENGHVECLRFLLEHGAPCEDVKILRAAAGASTVSGLKYLIEEQMLNVPSDGVVFGEALMEARIESVRYLVDNDHHFKSYVFTQPTPRVPYHSKLNDKHFLQCIQYAVEHGWEYNRDFYMFVKLRNSLSLCQAYLEARLKV